MIKNQLYTKSKIKHQTKFLIEFKKNPIIDNQETEQYISLKKNFKIGALFRFRVKTFTISLHNITEKLTITYNFEI